MILFVDHLPPNSYFLRLSLLDLIPRNLSSTAQVSLPSFQISLTFGTSIVHYFLRLMNTFSPPLPLSHPYDHPQVLHHICPLFFCHIFRIYHCIHRLLPRSAHPWLPFRLFSTPILPSLHLSPDKKPILAAENSNYGTGFSLLFSVVRGIFFFSRIS